MIFPDILFIDELNANLDEKNKSILIDYLQKKKSKKVFFIISHDKKFLEDCGCKQFYTISRNKLKKSADWNLSYYL